MSQNQVKFIKEAERQIPVYKKVDVLVAGSGPGGLGAAIAAARNGAKTLLVERNSYLGGQGTAALQVWFGGPTDIVQGIAREVIMNLDNLGVSKYVERGRFPPAAKGIPPLTYHMSFDPETYKFLTFDMVEESGADILLDTWVVDAILEDRTVKGVIIENKSGRKAILADVVIDATGDADIATKIGVPIDPDPKDGLMPLAMIFRVGGVNYQKIEEYARTNPSDFPTAAGLGSAKDPPVLFDGTNTASIQGIMQGWRSLVEEGRRKGYLPARPMRGLSLVGVSPYTIKHGIGYLHVIEMMNCNPWDIEDTNKGKIEGRKRVRKFFEYMKNIPGFETSYLIDIAPSLGAQDSRRIIGEYVLSRDDIRHGRTFEDDITLVTLSWPDTPASEDGGWMMHPSDGTESSEAHRRALRESPYFQVIFGVPYRCLIPKNCDRLLVAGQTISMTYMGHEPGSCRNMVTCMTYGEAAGTAAAMAVWGRMSIVDTKPLYAAVNPS